MARGVAFDGRGEAPAPAGGGGPTSWRRRHPVLARSILYGAGLVLAVVGIQLYLARRALNAADHLAYLEARLDDLDLLAGLPSGAAEIQKVLRSELADPALPPSLRQRALRVEAQLASGSKRPAEALRLLDEARALASAPDARRALLVERSEVLQALGQGDEALRELDLAGAPWPNPTLETLRRLEGAWIRSETGAKDDAARDLDQVLQDVPNPPPDVPPVAIGFGRTSLLQALVKVAGLRARIAPEGADASWRRLAALAPGDYAALEAAARGLLEAKDPAAREVWARAKRLDPRQAAAREARDPAFGALASGPQEVLKSDGEGGR